jgi:hypothetical protein
MAKPTLETLDQRVQALENRFWVAVVVAAIFGISGAWGFTQLHDAQKQLDALKDGIAQVNRARDAAIQDIKTEAPEMAKQAVAHETQAQIGKVKYWVDFMFTQAPLPHTAQNWRYIVADACNREHRDLGNDPGDCRPEPAPDPNR